MTAEEALQRFKEIVGDDLSDGEVNLRIRWNDRPSGKLALADIREMRRKLVALAREISPKAKAGGADRSTAELQRELAQSTADALLAAVAGKNLQTTKNASSKAFSRVMSAPYAGRLSATLAAMTTLRLLLALP